MGRFYARFDSGSSGWVDALDLDYFNRRRIGGSAITGSALRLGLITSQSILSADVYADLRGEFIDGTRGTYFPAETGSGPLNTDNATFLSWSTAYTASAFAPPGIIIPANYRTRPTASVPYDDPRIGAIVPANPVYVAYSKYIATANATEEVLNAIQDGNGTLCGPYTRLGNNPTRTLYSVWYDEFMQYFAWDDFTPGEPPPPSIVVSSAGGTAVNVTVDSNLDFAEFQNDTNAAAPIGFLVSVSGTCNTTLELLSGSIHTPGGNSAILIGADYNNVQGPANCAGGGNSTWNWDGNSIIWNINVGTGTNTYQVYQRLYDVTIQTHTASSATATTTFTV